MKVGFLASWQRARSLFTWLVLSLIAATARAANTQQGSKECIRSALPRVYTSCASTNVSVSPRDELIRLLQDCMPADPGTASSGRRKMRLLSPVSTLQTMINPATQSYSKLTGIQVQVETVPIFIWSAAAMNSIANAANYNKTHDAWMLLTSYFMGDGVALGSFRKLTDLVALDTRLNFGELLPVMRRVGLLYQSEVYALPITTYSHILIYRKDMFAKHNLTLPRTWKELIAFSQRHNGTEGLYAFCPPMSPPPKSDQDCYNYNLFFLWSIMASYHQTHGATQSWFIDPETLTNLVGAASMPEVTQLLMGLWSVTAPDQSMARGCPQTPYRFAAGQCLMTVMQSASFKVMAHRSRFPNFRRIQGNLGIAPWPGSETVLDRASNKLVPCDATRCPYATRYVNPDGSELYINVAPYVESSTYVINAHLPQDLSFFTYQVMSYLTSAEVSTQVMLLPDTEVGPVRQSQFRESLWISAGYNAHDANEYLTGVQWHLNHPNVAVTQRFPGVRELGLMWYIIIVGISLAPPEIILPIAVDNTTAVLKQVYGTNTTAFRIALWESLNRQFSPLPPPRTQTYPPPPFVVPTQNTEHNLSHTTLALSIALPAGFVLIAALAVKRYRGVWSGKGKKTSHPGPGPCTCLCVTDIENSTSLWEELDARVMDTAAKLHNVCIRNLAAEHNGYESVWEGDSFILAFHHPSDALAFSMTIQVELLYLPWPTELLNSPYAKEVWCTPLAPTTPRKSIKAPDSPPGYIPLFGTAAFKTRTSTSTASGAGGKIAALMSNLPSLNGVPAVNSDLLAHALTDSKATTNSESTTTTTIQTNSAGASTFALVPQYNGRESYEAISAPLVSAKSPSALDKHTYGALWQSQWRECSQVAPGAVLGYRGLRVRLGMHAGVDGDTFVAFNTVMQRYHYTGSVRVVSNAVASAGHGGQALLSSATAELLGPDERGMLTQLPNNCRLYHQGCHKLSGVEHDVDLLLAVPDVLKCRLALQQAALRSVAIRSPGVRAAPAPAAGTTTAADSTALLCLHFVGLPSLLAWNKDATLAAAADAMTCIHEHVQDFGGVICQDGLQRTLLAALADAAAAAADSHAAAAAAAAVKGGVEPGRLLIALDPHCHTGLMLPPATLPGTHVAVEAALSLRTGLLQLEWSSELLSHELAEPVGLSEAPSDSKALATQPSYMMFSMHPDQASEKSGLQSFRSQARSFLQPVQQSFTDRVGSILSARPSTVNLTNPPAAEEATSIMCASATGSIGFPGRARSGASGVPDLRASNNCHSSALAPVLTRSGKSGRYDVFETLGVRGLRCKMSVVSARGASVSIATRGSGRATYTGAPVKRARKLVDKARVGQILVDHALLTPPAK